MRRSCWLLYHADGAFTELGVTYTLKVLHQGDLNRQIVRSQACEISIPEFELTLPPNERGQLTTVEGLLRDIVADLGADQPLRRIQNEAAYLKIQEIISGLKEVIDADDEDESDKPVVEKLTADAVNKVITIVLDDPSGNSFLEFVGNIADPKWSFKTYTRTLEQAAKLGLAVPEQEKGAAEEETGTKNAGEEGERSDEKNDEIFEFTGICPCCGRPLVTRMKNVPIPYFKVSSIWLDNGKELTNTCKDTLIMSTNCENCGYRDNEVKSGSAISKQGKKIILKVVDQEDLGRDILKVGSAFLMKQRKVTTLTSPE